jgi:hypothetical protein
MNLADRTFIPVSAFAVCAETISNVGPESITRLVFRAERGRIIFFTAGSHDAIRKLVKDL